jgi:glycosyltransferase involved in cell wall biosynthesis
VAREFTAAPRLLEAGAPRVSVVVAAYNAARTLPACLESLTRLNYPDYEVLLVDDGSTDGTREVARKFPSVRYFRLEENQGLSVARNSGTDLATGEIVAFTDADCRADADWLRYLVHDLQTGGYAGIGGHNLLPPDDSALAAAVMAAPGGPLPVMLNDRIAEHLPGCNMAFWRDALRAVGGFDPVFRKAGDDVDLCWRLQATGCVLGFSPGGFVWHYRRSTVGAYLRQQHGYGEAEALLERKHPERFNRFGGSRWRGRIYGGAQAGPVTRKPIIYHGRFGLALFQTLYRSDPSWMLTLATSIEYYVLLVLPLAILGAMFRGLLPAAGLAALVPLLASATAAGQARLPERKRRLWSRPVLAVLFLLQPLVRGWARYQGRLFLQQTPRRVRRDFRALSEMPRGAPPEQLVFQAPKGLDRPAFLERLTRRFAAGGWQFRTDTGWSPWDLEVYGSRWSKLQLTTAAEYEPDGRPWIRCRLRAALPLPARLALGALSGVAVLWLGLRGPLHPGEWLVLLLPAAFAAFLRWDQRGLRREAAIFVRRVAEELGMTSPPDGGNPKSASPNPDPEKNHAPPQPPK